MIIVAVVTFLVILGIDWAICAAIPRDPYEDQEQERYLAEWGRKHEK